MKNSYTEIHYGEELRPKNKYDYMVCKHLADNYFKAKKGNLLDVCCGKGKHIEIFQEMGFDAWGIDMELTTDNQMIVKCNVDKEKFPFEDNTFDFILVKSAIEHVRNIYPFMEEVYRVLKKGGKVVILTCDWKAVHKIFYDDADHKSPFTKFSLKDLLLRYDFKDVSVDNFYYFPTLWKCRFLKIFPPIISFLCPIWLPQTVKINPITKIIKFSKEKQIIGYGEK